MTSTDWQALVNLVFVLFMILSIFINTRIHGRIDQLEQEISRLKERVS